MNTKQNHLPAPAVWPAALCAVLLLLSACPNPSAPQPPAPILEMVAVPGGRFQRIWFTPEDTTEVDSFSISRYEVTQAQYMEVTGKPNPSWNIVPNVAYDDLRRPVDMVSWFDALVFCNLLSIREGRTPVFTIKGSTDPEDWGPVPTSETYPGYADWRAVTADWNADGFRLPTEAEWTWAAMGAASGIGSWSVGVFLDGCRKQFSGDETPTSHTNLPDDYAWYEDNSEFLGSGHEDYGTHAAGTRLPNEIGLYDMSGNVFEWCWDIYAAYPSGHLDNPTGADTGDYYVFRGGCWLSPSLSLPVADRSSQQLACKYYPNLGFRVLRRP